MSDFSRPRRPTITGRRFRRNQPTPFEQEIAPFVQIAQEGGQIERPGFKPLEVVGVDERRARIRPLQFIFNLLQTGQYFSAGIADEITQSVRTGEPLGQAAQDAVKAAFEGISAGLTGRRPEGQASTFEDIIWGRKAEDGSIVRGWAGYVPEDERKFEHKAVGFVADVFLDPFTIISAGPSNAARVAAARFAKDATSIFLKSQTDDVARKLAGAFDGESIESLNKALVEVSGNEPLRRAVHDHYNKAFQRALRLPRGADPKKFGQQLQEELVGQFKRIPSAPTMRTGGIFQQLGGEIAEGGVDPSMRRLMTSIGEEDAYGAAGEQAARILGLSVHTGVRAPGPAQQAWRTFRSALDRVPIGKIRFADAWWAIHNGEPLTEASRKIRGLIGIPTQGFGMVALLRKTFGFFRDPFEKMLHLQGRKWESGIIARSTENADALSQIKGEIGDEDVAELTRVFAEASERVADRGRGDIGDIALGRQPDPGTLLRRQGNTGLAEVADRLQTISQKWFDEEHEIVSRVGSLINYGQELNYFPKGFVKNDVLTGTGKELGTQEQIKKAAGTLLGALERNRRRLKLVFGDEMLDEVVEKVGRSKDEILDEFIINKGFGDIELDIFKAYEMRGNINARIRARSQMVEALREFGIPVNQLTPQMQEVLNDSKSIHELGLKTTSDPAFQGMVFDREVADIIDRVFQANTPEGVKGIKRFWYLWTSLFKGFATTTPRFHVRNWASNQMTGFLKHGVRWFSPVDQKDALIAATYAMHKGRHIDILAGDYNLPESVIARALEKRIGNRTLREIADEARELGVINPRGALTEELSLGTRAGELFTEKIQPFKFSRQAGDLIENHARMTSFLLDLKSVNGAPGGAEWAAQEAKKWYLDYSDLQPLEKSVMRNVIPFYCFDTETEVLTAKGWSKHDEIKEGDGIFTVNLETHEIELQETKGVAHFDYDGDLIRLENRNIDLFATPNHRCIWDRYLPEDSEYEGEWRIKEAKDLRPSDWLPIATEGWRPKTKPVYSDDFVEMVGWVVCEGTVCDAYVNICQSEKNTLQRIKWCLLRLGWSYAEYDQDGSAKYLRIHKPHADLFRNLVGNPKKLPVEFVLSLTRSQLELLHEVMIEGDGCRDLKSASSVFFQKDHQIADTFQMVATLIGKASRKMEVDHSQTENRFSQEPINAVRTKMVSHVQIRNANMREEPYKGQVWCPSTPNGTVICRRNGKVYPSGQTWMRKNIGNQLSGLFLHGDLYSVVAKGIRASTDDEDFDWSLLEDWQENLALFPTWVDPEAGVATLAEPFFAFQDLNRMLPFSFDPGNPIPIFDGQEIMSDLLSSAHPALKTIAELATGVDVFRQREIRKWEVAPRIIQVMGQNPALFNLMDGIMRTANRKEGLGLDIRPDGTIVMDGSIQRVVNNNMPLLSSIASLFDVADAALTLTEEDMGSVIDSVREADDYNSAYQTMLRGLGFLGPKIRRFDIEEAERSRGEEVFRGAEDLLRRQRSFLPGAEGRVEDTRERRRERLARLGL